jgi:hypothetical protein
LRFWFATGGEQVHAGDPVVLNFGGAVADFAAPMEADGALERDGLRAC